MSWFILISFMMTQPHQGQVILSSGIGYPTQEICFSSRKNFEPHVEGLIKKLFGDGVEYKKNEIRLSCKEMNDNMRSKDVPA